MQLFPFTQSCRSQEGEYQRDEISGLSLWSRTKYFCFVQGILRPTGLSLQFELVYFIVSDLADHSFPSQIIFHLIMTFCSSSNFFWIPLNFFRSNDIFSQSQLQYNVNFSANCRERLSLLRYDEARHCGKAQYNMQCPYNSIIHCTRHRLPLRF